MNVVLQQKRLENINHIIFIDTFYQYFVSFREIKQHDLLHDSFYLAIVDHGQNVERIRCRVTFIALHLRRHYYRFEPLHRDERDSRKNERFNTLLRESVNRSALNGSLLLSPLPRFQ